jgi:hypothetical protein
VFLGWQMLMGGRFLKMRRGAPALRHFLSRKGRF